MPRRQNICIYFLGNDHSYSQFIYSKHLKYGKISFRKREFLTADKKKRQRKKEKKEKKKKHSNLYLPRDTFVNLAIQTGEDGVTFKRILTRLADINTI